MVEVNLKNGSSEVKAVVVTTMMNLEALMSPEKGMVGALAFFELVEVCRDSNHKIFSEVQSKALKELGLMQSDGSVHNSIRNVVLSAASGEGLGLSLGAPYA